MLQKLIYNSEDKIPYFNFFILLVCLSCVKNFFVWKYFMVHDNQFFHFPFSNSLYYGSVNFSKLLLTISIILSIYIFYSKKIIYLIPIGLINIYFVSQDLLIIHHDVLFSGVIFIIVSLVYSGKLKFYFLQSFFLAIYFVTGLNKLNPYFIEGDVVRDILVRMKFFGEIFYNFPTSFFQFLSILTIAIEIIFPIIFFFDKHVKSYLKLFLFFILFFYHLSMLITGTGTVFNILFPYLFLLIINKDETLRVYLSNYNFDLYIISVLFFYSISYISVNTYEFFF